ncbi:hypothetical protein MLD38_025853 [Melastoma candidum]|uniref:Uncharacterized protein n=1 Tax=Melastoma candidum TaxID=119954 RepID=A0ACB9NWD6_9MYRT|nr:hypothetical protein MLD38_025853 [Melastoma candidum]
MFEALLGWRKASNCKKLIRRAQRRLRLLRNKRDSIVRTLRDDVSRLVEMGYLEIATERAEQLLEDESVMEMYDLLNGFCELVITNMSHIRRHRECPNDVNEAVSSLIFASTRCGELPELRQIRELFRDRYGERFALVAVDLLPGNLVNPKIIEQLSMKTISNDSKIRITDEFVRDQPGTQPETLAIEYASELHKKIEEMAERQAVVLEIVPISPAFVVDSKQKEIGVTEAMKTVEFDAVVAENGPPVEKSHSQMQLLMKSVSPKGNSFVLMPPPYELDATVPTLEEKEGGGKLDKALKPVERTLTSLSGESSPQFHDGKVLYLDGVEEVQSGPKLDRECLDQRLFKFKQSVVPKSAIPEDTLADGDVEQFESSGKDNMSPRVSRGSKLPSGNRFRRSVSRETEIIDDVEYAVYYNAPLHNPRKHLKQSQTTDIHNRGITLKPWKVSSPRQESHCNCCECRKAEDHKVLHAHARPVEGFRGKRVVSSDYFSDTDSSCSISPVGEEGLFPSYVRAMTMPLKRQTSRPEGKIPRSNSSPLGQQPNHVHPKLPDYDELAAKFSELKKEFLGNCTKNKQHPKLHV